MTVHVERTPFDDGGARLWVDPASWDLRLESRGHSKVVFGDLPPGTALWSGGRAYRLTPPGADASIGFLIAQGLATDVQETTNPAWLSAVLGLLPGPQQQYASLWSRVGVTAQGATFDFSLPTGAYAGSADLLRSLGLTVVRSRMVRAAAIPTNKASRLECA